MNKIFYVALMLSVFVIPGNVSTGWSADRGLEPDPWERQQTQITSAPGNLTSVIGSEARIIAIRGNLVTIQSLTDESKTAKVTVNNTSLLKTGQMVKVTQKLLVPKAQGK